MRYDEVIAGAIPPYVFRLVKKCGKAVNDFDMIREGERVLLGISGGKDSLFLALCLSLRLKWLPVKYHLEAVMVEWMENPLSQDRKDALRRYFDALAIPFGFIEEPQRNDGFKGEFNCYLCSRNRRRILFTTASARDIHLIALGHHLDDVVETTMMNLAFRSRFESMNPAQDFFGGSLSVIRPLCLIDEASIAHASAQLELPVVKNACPFDRLNIRSGLKPLIRDLSRMDKHVRKHIFDSHAFSCKPKRSFALSEEGDSLTRTQERADGCDAKDGEKKN